MECVLFEKYAGLKNNIAWKSLGNFPTPVRRLEKLGREIGYENIWIKEDNKSSEYYGGNKVRKLEFTLPDALRKKKKTIMTYGGIGTNHGLATVIHGSRLGLNTLLLLVEQPVTAHIQENLLLDRHFGAELCYAQNTTRAALRTIWYFLSKMGNVYYLPPGGSSVLGSLGFVAAAFELKRQIDAGEIPEPKYIFVALGSKGTMAGLLVGTRLAGLSSKVIGVRVAYLWLANEKATAKLANNVIHLMGRYDKSVPAIKFSEEDVQVLHDCCGGGYGVPTAEGREAIEILERAENMELDLTYTGKTFAALLNFVKTNKELNNAPILYWHTYNSVDLTTIIKQDHDYRKLPKAFHQFFKTNFIPSIE
ncbi:MAG: pyridoxal-phosphate dependent enzyme [Chloroflexi bacterium]|nr:pyridoxal-phosphate dependent enzyme [Chloroflexota bacterium]